ncbi:hypothetical protein Tco_1036201 [Tanacetum coccineum]
MDKDLTVASKLGSTSLEASFRRPVRDGVERQQLLDLNLLTDSIILSSSKDRWICDLSGDGEFRVKDARIKLDDVFPPSDSIETRWVKYIPIKIYVFAWRVRLDRLPTRINLIRRLSQDMSLVGNVYVQFTEEEYAAKAMKKLTRRYYADDDEEDGNVVHEGDKKLSLDCEREDDNKPSLDYERKNMSSDERKLSGGDVFGKKIKSVLRMNEDHDNRLIMDEVKPSGGDEKVELVTKMNENVGVGSMSEKDKLQVDKDLEWDEIGNIGENDEKHVTQGGSLKKDEVSKRLNSEDDDEDLCWDTKDDDDGEPVKTGPVMIEFPLTRPTEDGTTSKDILVVIPGRFLRLDKCSLVRTPRKSRYCLGTTAWVAKHPCCSLGKKKRDNAPKEHSKRRMDVIG